MKRLTVLMFAVAVFLGGSASAFAQVFSNICWNVNQHAVVYQLSLNRNTGNGTGSWRWFDGSSAGGATAMIIPCVAGEALTEGDRASQGLQD